MIVMLHVDNCGACGKPVMYRQEPSVPCGWVFKCLNSMCGYCGIEHHVPTANAQRFYLPPKLDAA